MVVDREDTGESGGECLRSPDLPKEIIRELPNSEEGIGHTDPNRTAYYPNADRLSPRPSLIKTVKNQQTCGHGWGYWGRR